MTQMHLSTSCASFVLISLSLGDVDMDRGCIERRRLRRSFFFIWLVLEEDAKKSLVTFLYSDFVCTWFYVGLG